MGLASRLSRAEIDVLHERQRQINIEGFNAAHDDAHISGEIARAAGCYAIASALDTENALHVIFVRYWPWAFKWWKPKDRRSDLVRSAALAIAEIERIDRAAALEVRGPIDRLPPFEPGEVQHLVDGKKPGTLGKYELMWCSNCNERRPFTVDEMKPDARNQTAAADILCNECKFIIATAHRSLAEQG